jgi:hypothetical protein
MEAIKGDEDQPSAGVVPFNWLEGRRIGEAIVAGNFVDIGDADSIATLRSRLGARAIYYG